MQQSLKIALRAFFGCLLAAHATLVAAQPTQQPYPNKMIKIVVGVPPGGSTDSIARLFADSLKQSLGQSTIVENRPGANTAVAADAVARSAPDGHTLLVATDALITVPLLTKAAFDPIKNFAPIGILAVHRFVMAVHPSTPVNTVQEFIAYAKARPGQLNYGSSGNGGPSHLGIEKFKLLTETHIVHVPYKGMGPAMTDAIAGQYQLSLWTPFAVAPYVSAGKLRPLALTGPRRLPLLPEVPTFTEAGLAAFDHKAWQAVFAPEGTPKHIIDQLRAEIQTMLSSAKVKEVLEKQGVEPFAPTPEQMAAMMRAETAETSKLVKAANIKMD